MTKKKEEEKKGDIVIARPVINEEKPWLFKKGNPSRKGHHIPVPLRTFRKSIQDYWDAKHLFYLDKWLNKTSSELENAQYREDLSTAEYIIVKFLASTINTPHPSLVKLLIELSSGQNRTEDPSKKDDDDGTKTVRRIILKMPKSKRRDESISDD